MKPKKTQKSSPAKAPIEAAAPAPVKSQFNVAAAPLPAKAAAAAPMPATPIAEKQTKPKPVAKTNSPTHKALAAPTTIEALIDVGFGNSLFIRGEGDGLSWEKGAPLECRESSIWVWTSDQAQSPVTFKLLLNDQVWAHGSDHVVAPGERLRLKPVF